jgi:regulator of protease activity HflC (stomatin/prohibitin superfamily)
LIHADGEAQAAERLAEASRLLSASPSALQLRYLQTLTEISTENSSTIIFPLPLDLIEPFFDADKAARRAAGDVSKRTTSDS